MEIGKSIEIPFGAKDSELKGWEYTIPEGMEAEIKDGKIIVKGKESEDERIRRYFIDVVNDYCKGSEYEECIDWLERQGEHIKFLKSIQIGDEVTRNPDGVLVNLSQFKRKAEQGSQNLANSAKTCKDEHNPAWSEEDETGLNDAMWAIEQARTTAKDENDMGNLWYAERWLKSLKSRVQPQPKSAWSEEDEGMEDNIFKAIQHLLKQNDSWGFLEECLDWLNSLKERYTWKPSDEQMLRLKGIVDSMPHQKELFSLYTDLKKLKG